MALNKTIPTLTLACLIMLQPAHGFSLPDAVPSSLDEVKALGQEAYARTCRAKDKAVATIKRNKEIVGAVTVLTAVAAFYYYNTYCAEKGEVLPGTITADQAFKCGKKAWIFNKAVELKNWALGKSAPAQRLEAAKELAIKQVAFEAPEKLAEAKAKIEKVS